MPPFPPNIDHLILGAPDLDAGVAFVAERLGASPVLGGSHPQWGTRNALLALDDGIYFEIIAPDPAAGGIDAFGFHACPAPRLFTWVMRDPDLEVRLRLATRHSIPLGAIQHGGRQRPDGSTLSWRLTDPLALPCRGLVPFFIDWGDSPHPSTTAPRAGRLAGLTGYHPDPNAVRRDLGHLGLSIPVEAHATPHLEATIEGLRGTVRFT